MTVATERHSMTTATLFTRLAVMTMLISIVTGRPHIARAGQPEPRAAFYTLRLGNALPGGKSLTVYLDITDGRVSGALGKALEFNKVAHDVDASRLALTASALTGAITVRINPDAYAPPDGKPVACEFALDARRDGATITGSFSGRYNLGEAEQAVAGPITGSVAPPIDRAGLLVCNLHMEGAVSESPKAKSAWAARAFPSIVFNDGKPVHALIHGHGGGRQVNHFEGVVTDAQVKWDGNSFAGPINVRAASGDTYVFAFSGKRVGNQIGGTYEKTFNGKPAGGDRFHGVLEPMPKVSPDHAIYNIELTGAVAGGKHLNLFLPCRDGRFQDGFGYAGTFNHTFHDAVVAGLAREGDRLTGEVNVTINPDPYVPKDRKPIACAYKIDAKIADGCLTGTFSGTFGGDAVTGQLLGRLHPITPAPNPARVHLKLEDGLSDGPPWFRRVFVGFVAVNGKAESGSMGNNKGGWTGALNSAAIAVDGSAFTATIEGAVDTTRGPKTGAYTFKLRGKLIGEELAGKVETWLDGKPVKKDTDFMGSLRPATAPTSSPSPDDD
jgi:hypothetical protein